MIAAIVALMFLPLLLPQIHQPALECQSLVMLGESAAIAQVQPHKGEKYRRPPRVAYEVMENGDVRKLRLVRHSGIKELDANLLLAASRWKYHPRAGCGTMKVSAAFGPIPNEETALKVATPELIRRYGASVIASERPLTAEILRDMWIVGGTLHCRDGRGATTTVCVGGVATAQLSKSDGRIIRIFHTMWLNLSLGTAVVL